MTERERNVELARATTEAFNRGDVEAVLASMDPEIEIYSTPDLPNPGTFTGPEGWVEWASVWLAAWEGFRVEIEDHELVGNRHVVMRARQSGKGAGSGVPVEMHVYYLVEYRDGLVVRFHLYATHEQALEVAQAEETEAE